MSFKYNSGNGAIICDECSVILKEPAEYFGNTKDYCEGCKEVLLSMNLVKTRDQWLESFRKGEQPTSRLLQDYRQNRDNEMWRASKEVEELCEYIIYLEEQVNEWTASSEYNYKLYNDLMSDVGDGQ